MSASTFLDYCLTCDRQIEACGEVYCSQQCRLADVCTLSTSSSNSTLPSTPYDSATYSQSTQAPMPTHNQPPSVTSANSSNRRSNPFVLPAAYDFSSHRNSITSISSTSQTGSVPSSTQQMTMAAPANRPNSGYFASYAGSGTTLLSSSEAAKRTLSPTSSRSSIASVGEDSVRHELRIYESNFDQVRDWRRRRASIYENMWKS